MGQWLALCNHKTEQLEKAIWNSIDMKEKAPEYLQGNIDAWQKKAAGFAVDAEEAWVSDHPSWGIWGIPESSAHLLPANMSGLNCIELARILHEGGPLLNKS